MNLYFYDFETMGVDPYMAPVLSFAGISIDFEKMQNDEYTLDYIIENSTYAKFDVREQIKDGCIVEKETMDWWSNQGEDAKHVLKPSKQDISIKNISDLFIESGSNNAKFVYTRGNTFDPIFIDRLVKKYELKTPYAWWTIRDTRSYIEGLMYPLLERNDFDIFGETDQIVKHNPRYDIAADILRIQLLVKK